MPPNESLGLRDLVFLIFKIFSAPRHALVKLEVDNFTFFSDFGFKSKSEISKIMNFALKSIFLMNNYFPSIPMISDGRYGFIE